MKKITSLLHTEYILWFCAGGLISARFLLATISYPGDFYELFERYYFELLVGVIVALFPFVYFQIFGQYPLESVRNRRKESKIMIHGNDNIVHVPKKENIETGHKEIDGGISLLTQLVTNSEELSNKIYRRSGVYLIFGVLIAFSGILYFSFQSISLSGNIDLTTHLLALLPRFGILFFIEFIAFFFLKQYRAAMNEFRHYDSITRNRESQLALYVIAKTDFKETNFTSVVDKINFFERVGILSKGETTELIESSKINKDELESVKNIVSELLKTIKQFEKKENT